MAYHGIPALAGAKPTFVMAAIGQLQEELVQPDWRAFEWGSGGSTLWLSQWCDSVVSVEHDPEWHTQIKSELVHYGIDNVELFFVPKGAGAHEYDQYSRYITIYWNPTFDLIFIDGRNRAACIGHAVSRLRPGGVLVLDDSQREQYQAAIAAHLAGWERWDHLNEYGGYAGWMTTIWRKP
jgi:predicted O-methyltransferase YrrM